MQTDSYGYGGSSARISPAVLLHRNQLQYLHLKVACSSEPLLLSCNCILRGLTEVRHLCCRSPQKHCPKHLDGKSRCPVARLVPSAKRAWSGKASHTNRPTSGCYSVTHAGSQAHRLGVGSCRFGRMLKLHDAMRASRFTRLDLEPRMPASGNGATAGHQKCCKQCPQLM